MIVRRSFLAGSAAILSAGRLPAQQANAFEAWRDLVNTLPDQAGLEAARQGRGRPPLVWTVQKIEDAYHPTLNLDRYEVRITRFPALGAASGGAEAFFNHVRRNFSDFLDPSIATFGPHIETDGVEWRSSGKPPLGSIHLFHILGILERGAVVLSQSDSLRWRFSPVRIGMILVGSHPVAGNRDFLLRSNGDGSHSFIVTAADRAYDVMPPESVVLGGAQDLWRAFQLRLVTFIMAQGGAAERVRPIVHGPSWSDAVAQGLFTRL